MFFLTLLFLCVNANTSTFIAAAFTPMSADGSALELANLTAYGQFLLSQGVSTVFVAGVNFF
jgi:dihydrodipicolinate synthase/N-acetylneuraminate lyase